MQYIKGNSVWIKLVPKPNFENLALAPGFAGERHKCPKLMVIKFFFNLGMGPIHIFSCHSIHFSQFKS